MRLLPITINNQSYTYFFRPGACFSLGSIHNPANPQRNMTWIVKGYKLRIKKPRITK